MVLNGTGNRSELSAAVPTETLPGLLRNPQGSGGSVAWAGEDGGAGDEFVSELAEPMENRSTYQLCNLWPRNGELLWPECYFKGLGINSLISSQPQHSQQAVDVRLSA